MGQIGRNGTLLRGESRPLRCVEGRIHGCRYQKNAKAAILREKKKERKRTGASGKDVCVMTFKRTKLADRMLPNYSVGEEIMNTVTHIVGGAMGVAALSLCVTFAAYSFSSFT